MIHFLRPLVLSLLVVAGTATSLRAQEISIPDPAFAAVIRETLQKPTGPLTQQDMLGLSGTKVLLPSGTNHCLNNHIQVTLRLKAPPRFEEQKHKMKPAR